MENVFDKIRELGEIPDYSKHEQLVNGVINAIDDKLISQGTKLPSVNEMMKEFGYANKTIVKAYQELKDRGLVDSKNRLGYFVATEATYQTMKVALLLYAFHPFQENFYNAFKAELGENTHVDVFFHHSNIEVFETILGNIRGRYGMYVIAPIPHPKTKGILNSVSREKLLLVDRYENLGGQFSHITQEFEIATYMALKKLAARLEAFQSITLFYKPDSDYPVEVLRAFQQFIKDYDIKGRVLEKYEAGSLQKNQVYFTIGDSDLWRILKDCKQQQLQPGEDIGIISNNDGPAKEIIFDGITTFLPTLRKWGSEPQNLSCTKNLFLKLSLPF